MRVHVHVYVHEREGETERESGGGKGTHSIAQQPQVLTCKQCTEGWGDHDFGDGSGPG